jgi:hypothetical protein
MEFFCPHIRSILQLDTHLIISSLQVFLCASKLDLIIDCSHPLFGQVITLCLHSLSWYSTLRLQTNKPHPVLVQAIFTNWQVLLCSVVFLRKKDSLQRSPYQC